MRTMMTNLREQGEKYNALKGMIDRANTQSNEIKIALEAAEKDVDKQLSYSNTVAYPMPQERKSYPSRLLIVIMTMASTFILALVIIAITDNIRGLNLSSAPSQKNG
jgi:capsule polysaccharide export protein KpsE/RkpR